MEEIKKRFEKSLNKSQETLLFKMDTTQSEEETGLLYGVFSAANVEDLEGDVISNIELEKMAHLALINMANGEFCIKGAKPGFTHNTQIDAYLVESYIDKSEQDWTWRGAIKIFDEEVKDNAKDELYDGFSVGGVAYKEEI